MRIYSQRLYGAENEAVRLEILAIVRRAVGACGPELERRILGLRERFRLDPRRALLLRNAAKDFRDAREDLPRNTCQCDRCKKETI